MNPSCLPKIIAINLLMTMLVKTGYAVDINEKEHLTVKDLIDLPLEDFFDIQIVSEATGSKQIVSKAPAIVKVITAEDIKAMGATDLEEVLETVPELHVTRNTLANQPLYLIRGIYSSYNPEVVCLIDNTPVQSIQYASKPAFWGGMSINQIARIEIIRGAGAAVHANAFAGTINIVTKTKADISGTEMGFHLGSLNTKNLWLLHGGEYGGFEIAAMWEYYGTEGPHEVVEADRQTLFDKQFKTQASLAPGIVHYPRDSHDARLTLTRGPWSWQTFLRKHDKLGVGLSAGDSLDSTGYYDSHLFATDFIYHEPQLTKSWEVNAQLGYLDSKFGHETLSQLLPPGAGGGAFPEGRLMRLSAAERQFRFTWSNFYSGFTNHLLRIETGYSQADVYEITQLRNFDVTTNRPVSKLIDVSDTPAAFLPEMTRTSTHLLLQDAWTFMPEWELTTGLRYYKFSDFGQTLNPLLGVVWQTNPNLVTKLLYGKAFRAPSLEELYTSTGTAVGNAKLKPETIHTTELAWEYRPKKTLEVNFNMFYYQIENVILLKPSSIIGKSQFQNTGKNKGYGFALDGSWQLHPQWKLTGNYAFQLATDQKDQPVPNAPRQQLYFRTDWKFLPAWNLDLQANWVGKRYRPNGDKRPTINNYTTVDATLRYQQDQRPWEIDFSARNLFDADAREPTNATIPNDLPLAGRSIWGEIRYRF